jgi:8-oxo-dGTP pyrophosphatase MutT (NUDIX family)
VNDPFELTRALDFYESTWERFAPLSLRTGQDTTTRFRQLASIGSLCYDRNHFPDHFTGSALVVTEDRSRVLLTLHRKLDKWLQLGGHADGDSDLWSVARREAEEEGGLKILQPISQSVWGNVTQDLSRQLWDIDVHWIPERKTEPGHNHFDARFVFITNTPEDIQISDESKALEWFPIERALELNSEWSMQRLLLKLQWWRQATN